MSFRILLIAFIGLFAISLLLTSCRDKQSLLQKDKSLSETFKIAKEKNLPFCIVLTDSTQDLANTYLYSIKNEFRYLTDKAVFNVVDLTSKQSVFYIKWLTPVSLPLTCVFSANGQLIDLIPGVSKESFLYIEQAVNNRSTTGFHWSNRFNKEKKDIIPLLGKVLEIERGIAKREQLTVPIPLLDSLRYPFLNYLALKAAVLNQDTKKAKELSQSFLFLQSPDKMELYKDEFIEAKKILNPSFNIVDAPNIRADKMNIDIGNTKVGKSTPINLKIFNDGSEVLRIEKIHMSCSCVTKEGPDSAIAIPHAKPYSALFYIKPETTGSLTRDIYIASNSFNSPNLHIRIFASVKP